VLVLRSRVSARCVPSVRQLLQHAVLEETKIADEENCPAVSPALKVENDAEASVEVSLAELPELLKDPRVRREKSALMNELQLLLAAGAVYIDEDGRYNIDTWVVERMKRE
jgi:hypothetical protein